MWSPWWSFVLMLKAADHSTDGGMEYGARWDTAEQVAAWMRTSCLLPLACCVLVAKVAWAGLLQGTAAGVGGVPAAPLADVVMSVKPATTQTAPAGSCLCPLDLASQGHFGQGAWSRCHTLCCPAPCANPATRGCCCWHPARGKIYWAQALMQQQQQLKYQRHVKNPGLLVTSTIIFCSTFWNKNLQRTYTNKCSGWLRAASYHYTSPTNTAVRAVKSACGE